MGIEITSSSFDEAQRRLFAARLERQLTRLQELLAAPAFGRGEASMGSELELYLIDEQARPAYFNQELHEQAADPQLTLEINRYNLEYNLLPRVLAESGFEATEREVLDKLASLRELAADYDARVVPVGILPTLRPGDFGRHCVTDRPRYRALVDQLLRWRGADFHVKINGAEPLEIGMSDITLEGANTSFQVHLRVDPAEYVDTFNAIQLVTPLALAISANSPGLFGHDLWDETRVPLFKQSIDTRHTDRYRWHEPARVSFGHGWLRRDAGELFEQAVRLYRPLLPACTEEAREGPVPGLEELRLHLSTVWLWNRPVYDDAAGGHLRIEMRALPAGPSAVDMVAGAALLIGLARGVRDELDRLLPALPFALAEYNFYRAAQHGIDARLVWPSARQQGLRDAALVDILAQLLPVANDGLRSMGVSLRERDRYMNVLEARLAARRSGSRWQRDCLRRVLDRGLDRRAALAAMLERYLEHSTENVPVAEWPL
ncbi:MAG: glutamate-cysteine ligase family protein [Halieaceae bacterium]|jgi:gamma-glutamyl:cysteine ligase YbdK (ATP-grasp superfamily)|nr:glutamate-cysteine ligase family protein [Halieaceae bacterium]